MLFRARSFLFIVFCSAFVTSWYKSSLRLKEYQSNEDDTHGDEPGAAEIKNATDSDTAALSWVLADSNNTATTKTNSDTSSYQVHDFSSALSPLMDFLTGPATPFVDPSNTTIFPMANHTQAVCEFNYKKAFATHFPHSMQQLYRCFSWWQANNNNNQRPVLLLPSLEMPNKYVAGFAQTLTDIFNVTIERKQAPRKRKKAGINKPNLRYDELAGKKVRTIIPLQGACLGAQYYQMHSLGDFTTLRQKTLEHYNWTQVAGCSTSSSSSSLRIGFLNRNGGRRVINHNAIQQAVQAALPNASIVYLDSSFNGMTFLEQAKYMTKIDILFGPHGAQLTSIPYLPACGGVLELFPKGFYCPAFFGSLATASGHFHANLYTGSEATRQEDMAFYMRKGFRYKARNLKITADTDRVVEALKHLAQERESCCRQMQ